MISPGYDHILVWKGYLGRDEQQTYVPAFEYMIQWVSWYSVAQEAAELGEWPLWNPYQFCGVPLLANYQTAFFYPPRILYFLMDIHVAGSLFMLLKVWLSGLTAYIFARSIQLSVPASYIVSIGWMLNPLSLYWLFWCSSDVMVWLPIQLLGIESLFQGRRRRGFFLIALSATLMLLAGHPETAFTMGIGAGLTFVIRLLTAYHNTPAKAMEPALLAITAWAIALLVCSAQLLPFIENLQHSWSVVERMQAVGTLTHRSEVLICALVPKFFGVSYHPGSTCWHSELDNSNFTAVFYPGTVVWVGIALILDRALWKQMPYRQVLSIGVPTLLYGLIVFHTGVWSLLSKLPILQLSWRVWYYPFAAFGFLVISAIAIDHYSAHSPGRRSHRVLLSLLPVSAMITCAWAVYLLFFRQGMLDATASYVQRQLFLMTLFAVTASSILCFCVSRMKRMFGVSLLVIVVAVDLVVASWRVHPTTPHRLLHIKPAIVEWLAERNVNGRVMALDNRRLVTTVPQGIWATYRVEDVFGHDGVQPFRLMNFLSGTELFGNVWPMFSIRYQLKRSMWKLVPPSDGTARITYSADGFDVWEDEAAWPRAKLISKAEVIPDVAAMLEKMNSDDFDPSELALLEAPPSDPLPSGDGHDPGTVRVVRRTPNTVLIEADIKARSILVLTDQYYPGWRACVDGQAKEVFPVYSLFRGIIVEPGERQIEFRYDPTTFRVGLMLSIAALFITCVVAIVLLRRSPPRRPYIATSWDIEGGNTATTTRT